MFDPIEALKNMGEEAPRLYCIVTGGGAGLQESIWGVPGVSNFLVGAAMPYEPRDTSRLLGFTPTKFVSTETAIDLAQTAYLLAYQPGKRTIGLGMTCSLASTREHRGDHRIVAAVFTENACHWIDLIIPKGVGSEQRIKDGRLSDEIAIHLLRVLTTPWKEEFSTDFQSFCEGLMGVSLPTIQVKSGMDLARTRILEHPFFTASGTRQPLSSINSEETIFYPGAFNPAHSGHFQGAAAARQVFEHQKFMTVAEAVKYKPRTLIFSTTVDPPHKDGLTPAEMLQRAFNLKGHNFLLTEGDGLYLDKAKKFPGACFILGTDALDRVMDPKWLVEPTYVLDQFKRFGTKLLVLGRLVDGTYMSCTDILRRHEKIIQASRSGLVFIGVPFRLDLSSTALRTSSAASA